MLKWFLIIAISAILIIAGMQLVPVYVQNYAIKRITSDAMTDMDVQNGSKRDLEKAVAAGLDINDIRLDVKEIMTFDRGATGDWVVGVKYEQRRKFLHNMYIVAAFDDEITN